LKEEEKTKKNIVVCNFNFGIFLIIFIWAHGVLSLLLGALIFLPIYLALLSLSTSKLLSCLFVCLLIFYYYLRDFARGMCMQINEKLQETKHGSCPGRKEGWQEGRKPGSATAKRRGSANVGVSWGLGPGSWELGIVVRAWVRRKSRVLGSNGIGVSGFGCRAFLGFSGLCVCCQPAPRQAKGKFKLKFSTVDVLK